MDGKVEKEVPTGCMGTVWERSIFLQEPLKSCLQHCKNSRDPLPPSQNFTSLRTSRAAPLSLSYMWSWRGRDSIMCRCSIQNLGAAKSTQMGKLIENNGIINEALSDWNPVLTCNWSRFIASVGIWWVNTSIGSINSVGLLELQCTAEFLQIIISRCTSVSDNSLLSFLSLNQIPHIANSHRQG